MVLTLTAKELRGYLRTPATWVVLAVLQFLLAWLLIGRIDPYLDLQTELARLANPPGVTELVVAPTFAAGALVLMLVVPVLGMRLLAEERRNRTLPLLLSAPLSMGEIVLGKFLALALLALAVVAMLTLMSCSLALGGPLDWGLIAASALGLALLALCYAAFSLYVSSLTAHPLLAALGAISALLVLSFLHGAASDPTAAVRLVSPLQRFASFNAGLIDSADAAYFLVTTGLFLGLTVLRLEMLRRVG